MSAWERDCSLVAASKPVSCRRILVTISTNADVPRPFCSRGCQRLQIGAAFLSKACVRRQSQCLGMLQYRSRLAVVNHRETAQALEIILDTRPRELLGNYFLVSDVCAKTAEKVKTCAKPVVRHRPYDA